MLMRHARVAEAIRLRVLLLRRRARELGGGGLGIDGRLGTEELGHLGGDECEGGVLGLPADESRGTDKAIGIDELAGAASDGHAGDGLDVGKGKTGWESGRQVEGQRDVVRVARVHDGQDATDAEDWGGGAVVVHKILDLDGGERWESREQLLRLSNEGTAVIARIDFI
jgi:hypothetical protein